MRAWDAEGKPRKPRVLCIGAQKAGTSWLHEQLNTHPRIWTTPFKEVHYFNARHRPEDRKWLPWHFREGVRGTERRFRARNEEMPDELVNYLVEMTADPMFTPNWYRRAFAPAPRKMLPLDTTPEYSTLPEAGVDEVAEFLPRAKFIYLIRDPVSRAISQLRMNLSRRRAMPKAPGDYLRHLDDADLADRGDYATYVPRWQARFGLDRLLILPYGRIASDPAGLMREVEDFLGLERHDYARLAARVHKGPSAIAFPEEGRAYLKQRFAAQYAYLRARFDDDFCAALDAPPASGAEIPASPALVSRRAGTDETANWSDPPVPKKPSVVGIGAQKAGTSWLYTALQQHPDLWAPPLKETHYFDHLHCPDHRKWTARNIINSARGVEARYQRMGQPIPPRLAEYMKRMQQAPQFTDDWYRAVFAPAPAGTAPLEITPAYSGLPPEGVAHVAEYLPEARFIYLIRDPVDRAISQLRMNLRRAGRAPADEAAWLHEAEDPVLDARGDYASYVPRWQAHFGPDRLLILPYGLIGSDPVGLMARIESFLGLPQHRYKGLEKRIFAAGTTPDIPARLHAALASRFAPQYAFLSAHFDAAFNAALR